MKPFRHKSVALAILVFYGLSCTVASPADPETDRRFLSAQSAAFVGCPASEIQIKEAQVKRTGDPERFVGSWALKCRGGEHVCSRVATGYNFGLARGRTYMMACRIVSVELPKPPATPASQPELKL